jgi:hypothetical protein
VLRRDDRALGPQQLGEHGELLAGQGNVPAVAEHLVSGEVEADAGAGQQRRRRRSAPPAERQHAGRQLGEREGLREVVVGAQ